VLYKGMAGSRQHPAQECMHLGRAAGWGPKVGFTCDVGRQTLAVRWVVVACVATWQLQ
jgi:hypothetical protein